MVVLLPLAYPAAILLLWLIQPWLLQWALITQRSSASLPPRAKLLLAAVIETTLSGYVAWKWHVFLKSRSIKIPRFFLVLLWYPMGLQILRYLHAWSVGPSAFVKLFGLTDFGRIQIFMCCPPTVHFKSPQEDDDKNKKAETESLAKITKGTKNSGDDVGHIMRVALMETLVTIVICATVLVLELHIYFPDILQRVLRGFILGYSVSFFRIVLEAPWRYWLRNDSRVARIRPIYDRPLLSTNPREFWHRWSVSAGYHLRMAFYEPYLQENHGRKSSSYIRRLLVTTFPFLVNCLLHITWWSIGMKGELDYLYWNLLFAYPLISFTIQDLVIGDLMFGTRHPKSAWHYRFNMALLWVGFCLVVEQMQESQGAPPSLKGLCRGNLLLKPDG